MKLKTLSVDLDPKSFTFDSMRQLVDEFLKTNKDAKKFWDCMAALRGPDVGIDSKVSKAGNPDSDAEGARIERKKVTSAIIRSRMFPGAAACSSALMNNDPDAAIILPDKNLWDHFDKHVFKAAQWLGIKTQVGDQKPEPTLLELTQEWDFDENSDCIILKGGGLDVKPTAHVRYLEPAFGGEAGIFERENGSKFVGNVYQDGSTALTMGMIYQVVDVLSNKLVIRPCGYSAFKPTTITAPISNYWGLTPNQISKVILCSPGQIKGLAEARKLMTGADKDGMAIAQAAGQAIVLDKDSNGMPGKTWTFYMVPKNDNPKVIVTASKGGF